MGYELDLFRRSIQDWDSNNNGNIAAFLMELLQRRLVSQGGEKLPRVLSSVFIFVWSKRSSKKAIPVAHEKDPRTPRIYDLSDFVAKKLKLEDTKPFEHPYMSDKWKKQTLG